MLKYLGFHGRDIQHLVFPDGVVAGELGIIWIQATLIQIWGLPKIRVTTVTTLNHPFHISIQLLGYQFRKAPYMMLPLAYAVVESRIQTKQRGYL